MVMLTEKAVDAVRGVLAAQTETVAGLRVLVKSGGCAGNEYALGLEAAPADDDEVLAYGDVKVFVDPVSLPLLDGVTVDFVEDITGVGFRFDNPNAVRTCGCGSSFSTDASAPGGTCSSKRA